jgi:hypothetical protein
LYLKISREAIGPKVELAMYIVVSKQFIDAFAWCREGESNPMELLPTDVEFPENTVSL